MNANIRQSGNSNCCFVSLRESPLDALRVFDFMLPACWRLPEDSKQVGSRSKTSNKRDSTWTRQSSLRLYGTPALRELRDWSSNETAGRLPELFSRRLNVIIDILETLAPEMAAEGLGQLNRSLFIETNRSTLEWRDAAKIACLMASLRDIAEAFRVKTRRDILPTCHRTIADRTLWSGGDLHGSIGQVVARTMHYSVLGSVEPGEITTARIRQAESASSYSKYQAPGWFLTLWATETRNLRKLWPEIRTQKRLFAVQDQLVTISHNLQRLNAARMSSRDIG